MSHTPEEAARQKELVEKKAAHLKDANAPVLTKEERHELAELLKSE